MVKKIFMVLISALIALMVFAPKKSLYYLLEKELKKSGVVISDEIVIPNPVGLKLENGKLYFEGIYIGDIKLISLISLIAWNRLSIKDFIPSEDLRKTMPLSISDANITYAVWNPLEISIDVEGDIGRVKGKLNFLDKKVRLKFLDKNRIAPIRRYLNKDKDGWYYEQTL